MARGKILCLHGSGASAEVRHTFNFPEATANAANQILRHQLYPLGQKLKEDVGVEFVFTQAELVTPPAIGVAEVYEGPYFSFFSWSDPPTSEDLDSIAAAYKLNYDMIEDEGPFKGILGFSQGATLACAFLLHHSQEHPYDLPLCISGMRFLLPVCHTERQTRSHCCHHRTGLYCCPPST